MNLANICRFFCVVFLSLGWMTLETKAQCPTFYDFNGVTSDNPYWYSCSGGNYTLNLQSPNTIGEWEVDWGDGSPVQSGAGLSPPGFINHTYSAAVDTFIVTFTELATGCVVQGVMVMEEATSASIQIPVGGLTQACAPQVLEFINSSTNVSETTVFTWNFGDGSPPLVFDHTNWGQIVAHLYEQGTVDCETVVTLTAENYCNTIQGGPSQATFNPIRIWDLDDAAITPSAIVQCYPDTTFTFTNTTERNCLFQGNIFQRQEYWDFGDYWGTGQDSIIDWTPWPPTFPKTIAYPGIGTYEVMMVDSNFCGQDTAYIQVHIVEPPVAGFTSNKDTICEGETVTFTNTSSSNATTYSWHFGTGPWINSGGGTITRTFNNAGTYLVQLVVSIDGAVGSCSDTTSFPIVVLPAPDALIAVDEPAACDSLAVNFSDASTGTYSSWQWILPSGEISNQPNPPTQYFTQPGAHTATLTVASMNGCSSTNHFDVFVHQTPQVGFAPQNVCQGVVSTFIDQSVASPGDSIISWNWDFGDGSTSTGEIATHIFPAIGEYTISLEVSTPHCSASEDFTIEVEPVPTAQFSVDIDEACGPLTVQFTNESTGAFFYVWHFGDGALSDEDSPSHTFYNFTNQDQVYEVMLVASTEFGCTDTAMVPVTVYPGAIAQFNATSSPGCAPFDAVFTNNSQGAVAYQWDFGDGSPFSDEESPTHTYVNQGLLVENFTVQLIAFSPTGCNDTAYTTVTAYPEPYFEFNVLADSGCSPHQVQFPNILGAVQLTWNFGDGAVGNGQAPSHTYNNNTNQPITYTAELIAMSAFGCIDTAYSDILVNPAPVAQLSGVPATGCGPLMVTMHNSSLNADSYVWTYGDGTSSTTDSTTHTHTFVNTTSQPVDYTITLNALTDDGCTDVTTATVTVYPEVIAGFDIPPAACAQSEIEFTNTSQNASGFTWYFGDGFIDLATSPTHNYFGAGGDSAVYMVTLEATSPFGCSDQATQEITIHPQPIADFTLSAVNGCGPFDVAIQNNSQNATIFNWQYGDNTGSSTNQDVHNHVFSNNSNDVASYLITLEAVTEFGCVDTHEQQVSVFPDVVAGFDVTPEGCSPFTPVFTDNSIGAMTYQWDFGNGLMSNGNNPTMTYVNEGSNDTTFTVVLTVQNQYGCVDSDSIDVLVYAAPQILFEVTSIPSCAPFEVVFENQSDGATSYHWNYGDGQTSQEEAVEHSHVFENLTAQSLVFPVTLEGVNAQGCENSMTVNVDILPQVVAAFTSDTAGCSVMQVTPQNESVGAGTYNWYLNDEWVSDLNNPTFELTNESAVDVEYDLKLVAQSFVGCTDTSQKTITVLATPVAEFTATPDYQVFPESTVVIENNSVAGNADFHWDFGNGETSQAINPGEFTYNAWGTFVITLTIDNGQCESTYQRTVVIDPPLPVAGFIGEQSGCQPVTVEFINTSEFGVQFLWDFGDGASSAAENPVHTYFNPGTYTVSLTVVGPGGDTDVEVKESLIEVYPQAGAFFTANPLNVTVPSNPVNFFNLSYNATEYLWDFGNGETSTEHSPQYYYQNVGVYEVTLIANNEYNCPDTFRLQDPIIAEGGGQIVFPNAFTPSTNGSSGGYFDLSQNLYNNDIFFPLQEGVEEYQLLIFNRWGELIFESREVNRGWDGYYKDELCKQDVYVWKVRAKFTDGNSVQRAGDVTLIR